MSSALIIDNDYPIRQDIYNYLERDGFKIKTTTNGAEGIQIAISEDFEFALIEEELSDHSGLKVLQAIKRVKPEIACFIISKHPSYETAVDAANLGACSYIPKPISYEELCFHLSKGEKHRQLFIEARNLRKERYYNLQELSREKSMFKTVLNAINGGVLVVNAEGELVYYNNAALKNLNLENLDSGEQILQKLPQPIIKQVSDYLLAKDYKSTISEIELEIIPQNKLFVQSVCSHIPKESNGFSGLVLVIRDITKKREIEQVKSQFVSMVAHELKNPLAAVEGFLQILQNPDITLSNEKKIDFLNRSSLRITGLFQLVNDLLDISRMELKEKYRELELLNFEEIIDTSISSFEIELDKKKIAIEKNIENNLPQLNVERNEISRVAINLMSNAIKYNKESGTISIQLFRKEDYLYFQLSDTGIGIKESDKPKLFQEFFRALNKQTRLENGTGLGLTIVKRIVESYHGKIDFESEYGVGTTFTVKLPIFKN